MIQLKDLYEWNRDYGGSFTSTICKAISLADDENMDRLFEGFPELVDSYMLYTKGKTYLDYKIG